LFRVNSSLPERNAVRRHKRYPKQRNTVEEDQRSHRADSTQPEGMERLLAFTMNRQNRSSFNFRATHGPSKTVTSRLTDSESQRFLNARDTSPELSVILQ